MRYQIILADPPWDYKGIAGNPNAGTTKHYDSMSDEKLMRLDIPAISADRSVLFLWTTFPMVERVFPIIRAWGFEYKTVAFVWVKTTKGGRGWRTSELGLGFDCGLGFVGQVGWYTKSNVEICLLSTKGEPLPRVDRVSQLIVHPRGRHSEKPPVLYDRIESLFGDLSRIELFARNTREGWAAFGNDVMESIRLRRWKNLLGNE